MWCASNGAMSLFFAFPEWAPRIDEAGRFTDCPTPQKTVYATHARMKQWKKKSLCVSSDCHRASLWFSWRTTLQSQITGRPPTKTKNDLTAHFRASHRLAASWRETKRWKTRTFSDATVSGCRAVWNACLSGGQAARSSSEWIAASDVSLGCWKIAPQSTEARLRKL